LKIKIINNFITEDDCDYIVGILNGLDVFNLLESRGPSKVRIMRFKNKDLNEIVEEYAIKTKKEIENFFKIQNSIVSDYGAFISKQGYSMDAHIDTINDYGLFDYLKYSSVLYLNEEFDGGDIYFPNVNFSYSPKKGDLIIFPANDLEYMHGVSKINTGSRHTLAYWYSNSGDCEPLIN